MKRQMPLEYGVWRGRTVWRHPQYMDFMAVMSGFLLQWPTILTLTIFPVLLVMYVRLAISEERDSQPAFGAAWTLYATQTPRFVPQWRKDHDDTRVAHDQGR